MAHSAIGPRSGLFVAPWKLLRCCARILTKNLKIKGKHTAVGGTSWPPSEPEHVAIQITPHDFSTRRRSSPKLPVDVVG